MKTDSIGGHSRFNPFAEKWRAKNKKVHAKSKALDMMRDKETTTGKPRKTTFGKDKYDKEVK